MKKTVIYEFPDDFKFPEHWGSAACGGCPFDAPVNDEPFCLLTGDDDYEIKHPKCPFFDGAETVNCDNWYW